MSETNQDEFWSHINHLFQGVFQCADKKEAEGNQKMMTASNILSKGHAQMQTAFKK